MSVKETMRKRGGIYKAVIEKNPPWLNHVHIVHVVDFTIGVPADEGGTCDDGISPRPDEEIRSAVFIQTSKTALGGVLYETHRWPGSHKFKLSVSQHPNLEKHDYLTSDAIIGFIWKKNIARHLPGIVRSIPTPDPSGLYVPAKIPDGSPLDGSDLPPQDSTE
ncbi:hypothetical protein N0V84_006999 [Fusarium piperis]|uniref:Uncharacterized protein n=1 Tax=Fusarium piperis TaxID=1435070 RepID=A0A9W9BM94_9HYPO|nr:hypothetical protein N0V84_006999 [Fusarium piperis]